MKDSFVLIVKKSGISRMRKNAGYLNLGEIAVKINIEIPDSAFTTPTFSASLKLDEDQIPEFKIEPIEIESVLQSQGFNLKIQKEEEMNIDG